MDKLISMTALTIKLEKQLQRCKDEGMTFSGLQTLKQQILNQLFLFANFLSQKLELWMFVPCKLVDGVWVVLEDPLWQVEWEKGKVYSENLSNQSKEYQESKDRCLFDGFEYNFKKEWFTNDSMILDEEFINKKTIEDLVKYSITLTPTAKKQIGL